MTTNVISQVLDEKKSSDSISCHLIHTKVDSYIKGSSFVASILNYTQMQVENLKENER